MRHGMCLGQYDVLHLDAFGATLFNHSGWFWMKLMQKLCEETSSLKWGHWQVGSLSPILLFALYTLTCCSFGQNFQKVGNR